VDEATQRLADRLDLIELVNRYGRALDRCDWPAFDLIFAADAEADYSKVVARTRPDQSTLLDEAVVQGRDAIVGWLRAARANGEALMHFMTNHIVEELDGDRARTWHYVHERQGAYGSYEIEAVRTDEGWRIGKLTLDLTPRPGKAR
jgi:SnoaL-like domain